MTSLNKHEKGEAEIICRPMNFVAAIRSFGTADSTTESHAGREEEPQQFNFDGMDRKDAESGRRSRGFSHSSGCEKFFSGSAAYRWREGFCSRQKTLLPKRSRFLCGNFFPLEEEEENVG